MPNYRTKTNPLDLVQHPLELVDADGNRTVRSVHGEFTAEQMVAHGYYRDIPPVYDPATHKLGNAPSWDEQAGTVTLGVVAKSAEELAGERTAAAQMELAMSDTQTVRVLEDLIAALAAKGIMTEDDLPANAKAKLQRRRELRQLVAG